MQILSSVHFKNALELGCGTGKNTTWLSEKAEQVLAVDLSEEMMAKAKEKTAASNVLFVQADLTKPWTFANEAFDLITCSLILEHVDDLNFIFNQASKTLSSNGHFYTCELHPYKQYSGSKARFETSAGLQVLECFVHHASDYFKAATTAGFVCERLNEWFDDDDRNGTPRLLSFLFRKK